MRDIPLVTILLIFVNLAVICKSYSMECLAARESQKQFTYQFYGDPKEIAEASHLKNDELNQFYQNCCSRAAIS